MVRVENHSMEILDAISLQPLREFVHNGEVWVEGRPGNEYLIKISSHKYGTRSLADPIMIDGSSIGYIFQQGPDINLNATLGPIGSSGVEDTSGTVNCKAFRFSRPVFGDIGSTSHHGSIQTTWFKARDSEVPSSPVFFPSWKESDGVAIDSKKNSVGSLKSTPGSSDVSVAKATSTWHMEEKICTITIRYCEAAGLVAQGIIHAPPRDQSQSERGNSRKRSGPTNNTDDAAKRWKDVEVVDLSTVKEEAVALPKSELPCGPENGVDLTTIKEEPVTLPKSKLPCGPDNVVAID